MVSFSHNDIFLVTGASNGIGKAIAEMIIQLGGKVIGIGRNEDKLMSMKALYNDDFDYEIKDLSCEVADLTNWFLQLSKKYGKFRGLALAAGIQETRPISILKEDKLQELFNTNLFSNLFLLKGFSKKSVRAEGQCSCVLISSLASELGIAGIASYSASKGAINSAVKSLAVELARDNIRINAILPGHIETEMLTKDNKFYNQEFSDKLKAKYPLGLGKAVDVANLACFLLSDKASWISGGNYIIDGAASINF